MAFRLSPSGFPLYLCSLFVFSSLKKSVPQSHSPFPVPKSRSRSQRMPLQSLTRSARNKRFHEIKKGREKSRPHNFIKLTADSQQPIALVFNSNSSKSSEFVPSALVHLRSYHLNDAFCQMIAYCAASF